MPLCLVWPCCGRVIRQRQSTRLSHLSLGTHPDMILRDKIGVASTRVPFMIDLLSDSLASEPIAIVVGITCKESHGNAALEQLSDALNRH